MRQLLSEWWQNLSVRERKIILVLGAVSALTVFYLYVLSPQIEALGAIRQDTATVEQELATAERLLAAVPTQREALERAEADLDNLRSLFVTDMQDGAMIVDVGLRAIEDGVAIILFRPLAVVEKEHLLELPIEIGVRGAYPSVLSYLQSLQGLPNVSELRQLKFQKKEGEAAGGVQSDFLLVIYSDRSPEARLHLAQLGHWLVGRYDAFRAAGAAFPEPGVHVPEPGKPVFPGVSETMIPAPTDPQFDRRLLK
jgi:type IV pilus assembly protein PilO